MSTSGCSRHSKPAAHTPQKKLVDGLKQSPHDSPSCLVSFSKLFKINCKVYCEKRHFLNSNLPVWQIDDIKQIDLPHFTLSGLNSQSPCAEHAPTMSPERHCSPHAFPPQPCSEQGFSSALTQNPSPSQTPSPKLGLLQAKPHSIPLHVRTYKVGTKMERKTTSIQYKPFQ